MSIYNEMDDSVEVEISKNWDIRLYWDDDDKLWHAIDDEGGIRVGDTKGEAIERLLEDAARDGFETEVKR